MARRGSNASDGPASLYADVPATMTAGGQLQQMSLYAAARRDMAGTPLNLLLNPQTYQERVARVWDGYNTDTFFQRMINRCVDFSANGARWEVPSRLDKDKSWIERLTEKAFGNSQRREQDFWNAWSDSVNRGVPNVLPGMQEVTRWAVRHIMLGGMWVPHWQLGTFKFGKQEFLVPTAITCYPTSSIILKRTNALFSQEEIWYRLPGGAKEVREGAPALAHGLATTAMDQIEQLGSATRKGDTEGFALKYNWTPGDLVTQRRGGLSFTGTALYPMPPFFALLPQLAIRQKLFAADLSILDGIIQSLFVWKIGDKDNMPQAPQVDIAGNVVREGTIAQVRRLIQEGRTGPALELFLPYYVDLVVKQPDTAVLINETKYAQSTLEIFQAFGIFFARSAAGSRERMEKINISNFEEFLDAIRWHVRSFWQLMANHIIELNPGKLEATPLWSPRPLNTKNEAWVQQMVALAKMGKLSLETLLWQHGIDHQVEVPRIARELAQDVDDLTDANSPVSYVQRSEPQPDLGGEDPNPVTQTDPSIGPDGQKPTSETVITPQKQQGRPRGRPRKTQPGPTPTE